MGFFSHAYTNASDTKASVIRYVVHVDISVNYIV